MSEPIQAIATNNYLLATPIGSGYMETSALEYDGDKISGYSGSAFAGGTDLDFEYDAADNISAINNSAISTTPAQALYAKSPLYFDVTGTSSYMGINSANLARMLGVDETVLYSSTQNAKTTAFILSEPLTAFEKVRFEITGYTHVYAENTHQTPSANDEELTTCFTYYCKNSDGAPLQMMMGTYSSTDGLNYGLVRSKFLYMSNTATVWEGNTTDGPHLQKIIGIGRKEV